jgi:hypothetical protein
MNIIIGGMSRLNKTKFSGAVVRSFFLNQDTHITIV